MPSRAYKNTRITVEWPYEDHIPAIRYPITGVVVSLGFGPDQNPREDTPLEPADGECSTLMFRYIYETGMDYLHPELAEKIEIRKKELIASGEDEDDLDDFEIISEHLEDLGQAPMIIDMPTYALPGDGITIGLDLARALP